MQKHFLVVSLLLSITISTFSQQALELSNLPNNAPINYTYNFLTPIDSRILLQNGHQLTGDQNDLDNQTPFQIYYDSDTLTTSSNNLPLADNPILMAGKLVQMETGFLIGGSPGIFRAIIEKTLDDYDTNTNGLQPVSAYDPDFRFRYFMSIFGPRLILRNGVYRYDFHQGSDIIDTERPEDDAPIADLPTIQCMCNGVVTEFVKLDDPADIDDPNGVGRKTGIHCSGDTIVEPPLGDNSRILEQTGEGQYLVVRCDAADQYPISLGYADNDIYIAYRHLYDFARDFEIGDTILKGDLVGKMGQSGITSNYHLHLSALRRACSETPAKRFINVHPMYLFNPDNNPHLLRKMEFNPAFDNNSGSLVQQEINPEISFLNYDTITAGANPIVRIALPYSQTSLHKIIIRDRNGIAPTNEWTFDFLERGIEDEAERDKNHWDMNGDGLLDTVFIHHFNRGTSAQFLFNSHDEEAHFDGHPGRDWPITNTGLYRTSAYILDIKIVNYTGNKDDLEVEVLDIWGNGIKGIVNIAPFNTPATSRSGKSSLAVLDFKIIPNPTSNRFIQLAFNQGTVSSPLKIKIINSLGQVVFQQIKNFERLIDLDLDKLAKGNYILQVDVNGEKMNRQFVLL